MSNLEFLAAHKIFINILAAIGCSLPVFFLSIGVSSGSVSGSVSGYSVSSPLSEVCRFPVLVLSFCVSLHLPLALLHSSMSLFRLERCGNSMGRVLLVLSSDFLPAMFCDLRVRMAYMMV